MRRRCTSVFSRLALLMALLAMTASVLTACGSGSDNVLGDDTVKQEQRRPGIEPVPDYILNDAPILKDGGPSGSYSRVFEFDPHMDPRDRTYVALQFTIPSYFKVDTKPGISWSSVEIESGNSRMFLTVYRDPADAGPVTSMLKQVVEANYKGAEFQHRPPRLMVERGDGASQGTAPAVRTADEWTWWPDPTARIVQMQGGSVLEEGKMGDPDRAGMWSSWVVDRPEVVGAEAENFGEGEEVVADEPGDDQGDEYAAYVTNRVRTWDWNLGGEANPDLFRRTEHWYHNTSVWDRFRREGSNGEEVEGRTGVCRHNGFRYHVICEAASLGRMIQREGNFRDSANAEGREREDTSTLGDRVMVHIVYFYPETDAPIMQQVIQTLRNTLRAHRTDAPGGAPSSNPNGP